MHPSSLAGRRRFLQTAALSVTGTRALAGCGGGASLTPPTTAAPPRRIVPADPSNYLARLAALKAGDTLLLAPGDYGIDALGRDTASPPGLPIFGLHGTAEAPIVISGPDAGPRPLLLGRNSHNTVRLADASHVVVRRLEVDGRGRLGFGVATQGPTHDITIEDNLFRGHGVEQQVVAISTTGSATWNWVIRRNEIVGAGTGIYLGNSDGTSPFVAGLIEHNLIRDTVGYNLQIKHQVPWINPPAGMPAGPSRTVIRHNVFSKSANGSTGGNARPNLLVGDQPASGPGSGDGCLVYGNFFWHNPAESLFQGEGRIAFYDNLMVGGAAVRIRPHNGVVRDVFFFHNTVLSTGPAVIVSGGAPGSVQRLLGNAVFASGTPVSASGSAAAATHNVTGGYEDAARFLNSPLAALGALDLHPMAGAALRAEGLDLAGLDTLPDWNRDFNGRLRDAPICGAYGSAGANPGWRLALGIKP